MALYSIKNTAAVGSVFASLRGVQTIHPGKSKTVELSDSDRYHHEIVSLESGGHIEVTPVGKNVASEPAKAAEPPKPSEALKSVKPGEQGKTS